ncbi:DUF6207 family protein [Streptomyces rugosispiralis]|uniref:DUF6207 family protein n=1 Tax=Streptomyces rugosispiralis TaxID=2967341 RepID=A0ABT1VBM1_9ACTN|nr:DUF6207 family protein [Streptomyces rugosispiralis]MCQ8194792.1 DUF6207 family protein [Streptomyces rugosispiralis]
MVVVDVAAADDATTLAFQQLLADRWATASSEYTTRDAGEPGVRLRCYLDLRQQLTYHGCGEMSRGERCEHPFTSVG